VRLRGHGRTGKIEWVFLEHVANGGKGMAIRTALAEADGEISVIHDADLEYHPRDLLRIVKVFVDEEADAVFGSRFAGGEARRALLYRHELGNQLLSFLATG
jgi:glycosyltransferase involved in cell wall biosynthesis